MAVNVTITSSYIIDDFYNRSGGGDIYVYSSGGSGTGSSGGGATSLASLSDVNLGALGNNQVLAYDVASAKWVNSNYLKTYIDGSLSERDTSITWIQDNALFGVANGTGTAQLLSLDSGPSGVVVKSLALTTGDDINFDIDASAVTINVNNNTFVREVSLGSSFEWDDGVLNINTTNNVLCASIYVAGAGLGSNQVYNEFDVSVIGAATDDVVLVNGPLYPQEPWKSPTDGTQINMGYVNASDNVRVRRISITTSGGGGTVNGGTYKILVFKNK